jgi:hypothetical protein
VDQRDWLNATDPQAMLGFLRDSGRLTERKARLFAAACCRGIWPLLADERSREAVRVVERWTDGRATKADLASANTAAGEPQDSRWASLAAIDAVRDATGGEGEAPKAAASVLLALTFAAVDNQAAVQAEVEHQAALLRDIFGPLPFRTPPLDAAWLSWNGGTVRHVVEAIYEQREMPSGHLDNARLGVLADALEEVGCADPDILAHCRQPGAVHVRGCWVIDLLLQKP